MKRFSINPKSGNETSDAPAFRGFLAAAVNVSGARALSRPASRRADALRRQSMCDARRRPSQRPRAGLGQGIPDRKEFQLRLTIRNQSLPYFASEFSTFSVGSRLNGRHLPRNGPNLAELTNF